MSYILVILLGILLGSAVIILTYDKKKDQSQLRWYILAYSKHHIYVFMQILLIIICVLLYRRYGFSIQFASYVLLSTILTSAAVIDIQKQIIPDKLVAIGAILGGVVAFLDPGLSLLNSLLGFALGGGILLTVFFISKGSLGLGDVKLFACIGIFLGMDKVLSAMFISALLSGLVGLLLIIKSVSNRKKSLPFAPFILIGTLFTIMF